MKNSYSSKGSVKISKDKNDPFDPFKAFHDNEPPKVISYIGGPRSEFDKFAIAICESVDYTTKRVNVYGTVKGVDVFKVIIFNPLRNPELIIQPKTQN